MIVSEKRKHARLSAGERVFALVKNGVSSVGQIIDVSRGGLSFKYLSEESLPGCSRRLDVFVPGHKFLWMKIPHRTVRDLDLPLDVPFSSIRMKRRCVAFEPLGEEHLLRLEVLIAYLKRQLQNPTEERKR